MPRLIPVVIEKETCEKTKYNIEMWLRFIFSFWAMNLNSMQKFIYVVRDEHKI